jgi:hypothetical protein
MAKCPCPCPLVGGGTCGRFGSDTNKSGYVPGPRSTGIARDDTHVYVCPFHRKGWWAQKRGVTGAQEEKKLVQQYILQWDCGFATSIRAECAPSLEQPPAARCPSRKVSQCGRGRPQAQRRAQPPTAATKLPTPTCAPPKEDPAKEREIQVLLHQLHTLECEVHAVCGQCHELKSEIENTHWRALANVDSLSRRVSTNL